MRPSRSLLIVILIVGVSVVNLAIAQNSLMHSDSPDRKGASQKAAIDLLPEQEAVLRAIARGESRPWIEMTPEQGRTLREKVEAFTQRYRLYHLPHGQNADILWRDRERSGVDRYDGLGDGLIWTGHYLASLALRYSLEPSAEIRNDILAVLDRFDLLMRVSGRLGYLARYVGPEDDPAYVPYYRYYGRGEDPSRPGLGKKAYRGAPPNETLIWLGNSSRDAYDGFLFGIAMAWAYVRDDEIQKRIQDLTRCVADRMLMDGFWIMDGQGNITNPVPWFRLAYSRLFLTVLPNDYGGREDTDYLQCQGAIYTPEGRRYMSVRSSYSSRLAGLALFGQCVESKHADSYYPANLSFILMASLCALESDPDNSRKLKGVLRSMYKDQANDHLNAHFAAVYVLGTGNANDNDARATLQGQLIDFPDDTWARSVDLRSDSDIPQHNEDFTEYALLAHERVRSDFLWQRSPCSSHGGETGPLEYPGLDLILPYWMGRVSGAIPEPQPVK